MEGNELNETETAANQEQEIPSCLKAEEADALASCRSASTSNPLSCFPQSKQLLQLGSKRKMSAKRPKCPKSKVVSTDSRELGRKKRVRIEDLYDNLEAKFNVMERAGGLLARLASEVPTFVKCMLPSNVACGFWLIFPKKFCDLHLPMHDETIILVDEYGNECSTKFLLDRHGLSAGWRGFALAHRLHKGDILVFHLVGPCKLKVHIVRVYGLEEFDAALCLMNLYTCGKRSPEKYHAKTDKRTHKKAKKSAGYLSLDSSQPQGYLHKDSKAISNSCSGFMANESENNIDGCDTEVSDGSDITAQLQTNGLIGTESSCLQEHPCEGVPIV